MADIILEMKKITKVFAGVKALDTVDLQIEKGEVHALCGENGAGKSTLMKILAGLYQMDSGEILYKGESVSYKNPFMALNNGISMIHQEINLIQDMDIAENIWLGREIEFCKGGIINRAKRYAKTESLLTELNINLDPRKKIKDLSVAMMQLVELARAVSYHSQIIIMDEPTSALTQSEIDILYSIVKKLAKKQAAVIFISHKFEEIFEICDKVTVLRDGQYIATSKCVDIDKDQLIKMVAGRDISNESYRKDVVLGEPLIEIKELRNPGVFEDINFTVKSSEVLGFSGLMGAGRTEIMRAIFGIDEYVSGEIWIEGKKIKISTPGDAVAQGIGMVTEDRLRSGGIFTLSVLGNATLPSLKKISNKLQMFRKKSELEFFKKVSDDISIKYSNPNEVIGNLSGGNQQKTIFARWLLTNPKILILDEPTRGIDVGAKAEIYKLIDHLARQGMAIILVSSEMPELFAVCDRIIVIREGKIVLEANSNETDQETLIKYAFGV